MNNRRPDSILFISIDQGAFVWLQKRTGSTLATEVFENFGFNHYYVYGSEVDFSNPMKAHPHDQYLFNGHENYKLIATIRNPYTSLFSEYAMKPNISTEDFKVFLERKFQSKLKDKFFSGWERDPDYIIKVENLLEDYSKIPFIKESYYYKSGQLEKLINSNPNKNLFGHKFKDHINKDIAELIYYNTSRYFEKFGYHKDSWMI